MTNYTTFHKVLDVLESFVTQSPIMKTYGYGNLVDFGKNVSGTTVQYPFMFVVPQAIQYDENTTTYSLSILFADILHSDLSNEKDCVSDMSLEARRLLSYIKRGQNTFPLIYNTFDLDLPASAVPFMERMGDHVAGVALQTNLIVFEDINACDYYSPTPTITPTNTPTPTVTPTITLTPSPTDPRECRTYELSDINFVSTFDWLNCDGTPSGTTINGTVNICAKENTVVRTSGNGTITDIGTC